MSRASRLASLLWVILAIGGLISGPIGCSEPGAGTVEVTGGKSPAGGAGPASEEAPAKGGRKNPTVVGPASKIR